MPRDKVWISGQWLTETGAARVRARDRARTRARAALAVRYPQEFDALKVEQVDVRSSGRRHHRALRELARRHPTEYVDLRDKFAAGEPALAP